MAKERRRNVEVQLQGSIWWNEKEIFDAEMVRRSILVDRPRKDDENGYHRRRDSEVV